MEKIKEIIDNKKILILSVTTMIIVTLVTIIIVFTLSNNKSVKDREEESFAIEKIESEKKEKKEEIKYTVDIKGAVNNPGVYSLLAGSNVLDVINMAGGLKDTGDTSVINLSKKIFDQMVIIIYTKDEVNNFNKVKEKEIIEDKKCQNNEIIVNDACKENNNSNNNNNNNEGNETKKVNINTATLEELMSLTGIGEGKAKDIISYRDSHGLFSKIEDLMNVSGIGESTFAKIKENITV